MSNSLNVCTIIGNVGKDPDIRTTQSGDSIANLTIATSESWTDKQGQKQEVTEWHRVSVFGKLAGVIQKYVKKGSKLYIEGKLQTRKWTNKEGQDQYTTEIVLSGFNSRMIMLDSKGGGQQPQQQQQSYQAPETPQPDLDESIPF